MNPVAIVGIGCRFPGARGVPAYWSLLAEGRCAITEVPPDRWDAAALYDPDPAAPYRMVTRWGGFLDRIDQFSPAFWRISAREAARMDPQHRVLLEVVWEALEDAGLVREQVAGSKTGVFLGMSSYDYARFQPIGAGDGFACYTSALSIASNRLSYLFDWHGPSLTVDTACSSSLVALHLAVESLGKGECETAVVAGVNLILLPDLLVSFSKAGAMAPDGLCKAFDARANGYVRSEGCGALIVRPLERALAEGDRIYAVVRGTALNQDGRTNGLTAPNPHAQTAVIRQALAAAELRPEQVSYVEAHGTGTALGDPIEARAMAAAYTTGVPRERPLRTGSVKSNLGHLEPVAGIASLAKVALSMRAGQIPASLHFEHPNPHVDFAALQLRVQSALGPWEGPRFAGISGFGYGGTNAHVVLEAAPASPPAPPDDRPQLVLLSAAMPEDLADTVSAVVRDLRDDAVLADAAYTAALRRSWHRERLAVVGTDAADLRARLERWCAGTGETRVQVARAPVGRPRHGVVWVFSGHGGQHPGMARGLLAQEPVFAREMAACDAVIRALAGWSVLEEMALPAERSRLGRVRFAQPAVCAVQIALGRWWRHLGLEPAVLVGHSLGEVAAAHLAGALSLEDALRVAVCRAWRLEETGPGAMLAVAAEPEALVDLLGEELCVAVQNGPRMTVLSGSPEAVRRARVALEARGLGCRAVASEVAMHSPAIDAVLPAFRADVAAITAAPPTRRLISCVGNGDVALWDADHAARNLRAPVLFSAAISSLLEEGYGTFLELGPHALLGAALRQCAEAQGRPAVALACLRKADPNGPQEDRVHLLTAVGALWTQGYTLSLAGLWEGRRPVRPLAPYHWRGERCWMEPEPAASGEHPLLRAAVHPVDRPGVTLFEAPVDGRGLWADHRVGGEPVLPAAAWLDAALTAAPGAAVCEADFSRAVVLGESALAVRLVLEGGKGEFYAESPGETRPVPCASFSLGTPGARPEAADLDALRSRLGDPVAGREFYASLAELGLSYGPAFQGVRELRAREGEVLATLVATAAVARDAALHTVHPALLDAAFQALGAAIPASARGLLVPTAVARVEVFGPAAGLRFAWGRLRSARPGHVEADLDLLDATGAVGVSVRGLRLGGPRGAELRRDWGFALAWRPSPVEGVASGRWLVDDLALAEGLPGCALVRWRGEEPLPEGTYAGALISALEGEDEIALLNRAIRAAQALAALERPPRLFFLTRGTQAAHPSDRPRAEGAALWGLARTLAWELPQLQATAIDLGPGWQGLGPALAAADEERGVALRRPDPAVTGPRRVVVDPRAPGRVRLVPTCSPAPGPGELRLRVEAAGLNFRDVALGLGMDVGQGADHTLGLECAGVVEAVGEGVEFAPGDHVFAFATDCLGTQATTSARLSWPVPRGWSSAAAATLPVAFSTAWLALVHLARLAPGERVLIHAAAGGVGQAAMQIARWAGAEIIATAGSEAKRKLLREQGASVVLDSRDLAWSEAVRALGGVDVVLNSLAGEAIPRGIGCLRPFGRFVEIGKRDLVENSRLELRPFAKNLSFFAVDLLGLPPGRLRVLLDELLIRFEAGDLRPLPHVEFALDDAAAALTHLARAQHVGKVVLVPPVGASEESRPDSITRLVARLARAPLQASPLPRVEGTVLITGGLGALGRHTAQGLIDAGCRHLALWSRRAPVDTAALEAWRAAGVQLRVTAVDVEDRTAVQDAITSLEAEFPPISAVIHAAGVLDDALLPQQHPARVVAVMGPKVKGAQSLEAVLGGRRGLRWLAFSSAAAVLGSPGQASYAAANTWLESWCASLRTRGQDATAIAWGPWSGEGMAAGQGVRLQGQGLGSMRPEQGIAWLGAAWASASPSVVVLPLDAEAMTGALDGRIPPLLRELLVPSERSDSGAAGLKDLRPEARLPAIEGALQEIVAAVTGAAVGSVDTQAALVDLGVDSLVGLELRGRLEARFGSTVPLRTLVAEPNLRAMARLLARHLFPDSAATERTDAASAGWIGRPRPRENPRVRLVCFHHAGGAASGFHAWPALLPEDVEVLAVQLPGRESREGEPEVRSLAEVADGVAAALAAFEGPLALFGMSMGASLAYEVARRLVAAGRPPVHLSVAALPAPHLPRADRALHALADGALIDRLRQYGGLPDALFASPELLAALLPRVRADLRIWGEYSWDPGDPLPVPVSALGGVDDPIVHEGALRAWEGLSAGAFACRMYAGGHFFLDAHLREVLVVLAADLERSLQSAREGLASRTE